MIEKIVLIFALLGSVLYVFDKIVLAINNRRDDQRKFTEALVNKHILANLNALTLNVENISKHLGIQSVKADFPNVLGVPESIEVKSAKPLLRQAEVDVVPTEVQGKEEAMKTRLAEMERKFSVLVDMVEGSGQTVSAPAAPRPARKRSNKPAGTRTTESATPNANEALGSEKFSESDLDNLPPSIAPTSADFEIL